MVQAEPCLCQGGQESPLTFCVKKVPMQESSTEPPQGAFSRRSPNTPLQEAGVQLSVKGCIPWKGARP